MAHYHIVGIGGAGMSAIAHILLDQGHAVSGSDMQPSRLSEALARRGAAIFLGHDPRHVGGADALVVTSAVAPEHPEIAAARQHGIPVLKRADLWRDWSRQREIIAVAGTHGKTTTTAMIALTLTHAGMQPGFMIGAETPDLHTNAAWGAPGAPLVIEADEYDRTFLALAPRVAVITNVEWDHVDIYPSRETYDEAFRAFAGAVREPHNLIVCGDDAGVAQAIHAPGATHYGVDDRIASDPVSCQRTLFDWIAANLRIESDGTRFELWRYDRRTFATRRVIECQLQLPGAHNVRNALAAFAAAAAVGVEPALTAKALAAYRGTGRRFELKGQAGGVTVIDDYAHHPTEMRATLAAARGKYSGRRIIAYFQPHTYSRTRALLDSWATAFEDADIVLVGEIYAAREHDTLGMDSATVAARIRHQNVQAVGGMEHALATLLRLLRPGDVLLTLGAGDGYKVGELVLANLADTVAR